MNLHDRVARNQKQALLRLHRRHEVVLDLLKPVLGRTGRVARVTRDLPYVDQLPTPRESVDQWFDFFGQVLKEERQFVTHVVDLLPTRKVEHPVVKRTPKAA